MFEFARQNSQSINVGRKQKHGSNISVQSTAPPRRLHRAVGRSVAGYGRKEGTQEKKRKQSASHDNDQDDDVYYSLPSSQKQRQRKKGHSIGAAIEDNTSCARKHEKTMF